MSEDDVNSEPKSDGSGKTGSDEPGKASDSIQQNKIGLKLFKVCIATAFMNIKWKNKAIKEF